MSAPTPLHVMSHPRTCQQGHSEPVWAVHTNSTATAFERWLTVQVLAQTTSTSRDCTRRRRVLHERRAAAAAAAAPMPPLSRPSSFHPISAPFKLPVHATKEQLCRGRR